MDADVQGWEQIISYAKGHGQCEARIAALDKEIVELKAYISKLETMIRDNPSDPVARGQATRERPRQG